MPAEIRIDHDPQCDEEHKEHREVLVHREFPLSILPCMPSPSGHSAIPALTFP